MADTTTTRTLASIPHESITIDKATGARLNRLWLRVFLWCRTNWYHRTGMIRFWADVALVAMASYMVSLLSTIVGRLAESMPTLTYLHGGIIGLFLLLGMVYITKFNEFSTLRSFAENHVAAVTQAKTHQYETLQNLAHRLVADGKAGSHKGIRAIMEYCVSLASTDTSQSLNISTFADTIREAAKNFPETEREGIEQELTAMRDLSTKAVDLPPHFYQKWRFLYLLSIAALAAVCALPITISLTFIGSLAEMLEVVDQLGIVSHVQEYFDAMHGGFIFVAKGLLGALLLRRIGHLEDVAYYNEGGKPAFSDAKQKVFRMVSGGMELYRLKDLYFHAELRPNFSQGVLVFAIPKVLDGRSISHVESFSTDARHGTMFLIHAPTELLELHRLYW